MGHDMAETGAVARPSRRLDFGVDFELVALGVSEIYGSVAAGLVCYRFHDSDAFGNEYIVAFLHFVGFDAEGNLHAGQVVASTLTVVMAGAFAQRKLCRSGLETQACFTVAADWKREQVAVEGFHKLYIVAEDDRVIQLLHGFEHDGAFFSAMKWLVEFSMREPQKLKALRESEKERTLSIPDAYRHIGCPTAPVLGGLNDPRIFLDHPVQLLSAVLPNASAFYWTILSTRDLLGRRDKPSRELVELGPVLHRPLMQVLWRPGAPTRPGSGSSCSG